MSDIEPPQVPIVCTCTALLLQSKHELTELFIKALKHPIAAV